MFISAFSSVLNSSDENYAFLVMGTDTGGKLSSGGRTDFIVAASLSDDNTLNLTSIPRDTIVEWDGEEHRINSLNNMFGIEATIASVEDLIDKEVKGYAMIDFSLVASLTDFTGPIKVDITSPMDYDDYQQDLHIHFTPGIKLLEGEELLEYIRFRYDKAGDLGRIKRQREVLNQLINKITSSGTSRLLEITRFFLKNTELDFDYLPVISTGVRFLTGNKEVEFGEIPYEINEDGLIIPLRGSSTSGGINSSKLKILVVNNIPGYEKSFGNFSLIVSEQWYKRTGLRIDTCGEVFDLPLDKNKTYMFVNSRKEDLLSALGEAHPFHEAEIITDRKSVV